jgi:hypothetical protein
MRSQLLVIEAHKHFGIDIFVTGSQKLLIRREDNLLRGANPLSPEEALPIVALYLRSRGVFSPGVVGARVLRSHHHFHRRHYR